MSKTLKMVQGVVPQGAPFDPKMYATLNLPKIVFPKHRGMKLPTRITPGAVAVQGIVPQGAPFNPKMTTTGINRSNLRGRKEEIDAQIAVNKKLTDDITAMRLGESMTYEKKAKNYAPVIDALNQLGLVSFASAMNTPDGIAQAAAIKLRDFMQQIPKPDRLKRLPEALKTIAQFVADAIKQGAIPDNMVDEVRAAVRRHPLMRFDPADIDWDALSSESTSIGLEDVMSATTSSASTRPSTSRSTTSASAAPSESESEFESESGFISGFESEPEDNPLALMTDAQINAFRVKDSTTDGTLSFLFRSIGANSFEYQNPLSDANRLAFLGVARQIIQDPNIRGGDIFEGMRDNGNLNEIGPNPSLWGLAMVAAMTDIIEAESDSKTDDEITRMMANAIHWIRREWNAFMDAPIAPVVARAKSSESESEFESVESEESSSLMDTPNIVKSAFDDKLWVAANAAVNNGIMQGPAEAVFSKLKDFTKTAFDDLVDIVSKFPNYRFDVDGRTKQTVYYEIGTGVSQTKAPWCPVFYQTKTQVIENERRDGMIKWHVGGYTWRMRVQRIKTPFGEVVTVTTGQNKARDVNLYLLTAIYKYILGKIPRDELAVIATITEDYDKDTKDIESLFYSVSTRGQTLAQWGSELTNEMIANITMFSKKELKINEVNIAKGIDVKNTFDALGMQGRGLLRKTRRKKPAAPKGGKRKVSPNKVAARLDKMLAAGQITKKEYAKVMRSLQ